MAAVAACAGKVEQVLLLFQFLSVLIYLLGHTSHHGLYKNTLFGTTSEGITYANQILCSEMFTLVCLGYDYCFCILFVFVLRYRVIFIGIKANRIVELLRKVTTYKNIVFKKVSVSIAVALCLKNDIQNFDSKLICFCEKM